MTAIVISLKTNTMRPKMILGVILLVGILLMAGYEVVHVRAASQTVVVPATATTTTLGNT